MTYFHMGNPYMYDGWTYEWQAGRQLKSMTHKNAQNVQNKMLEFAYDGNGLRIQKKVTEGSTITTTDYTLHGKLVVHQKVTEVVNNGTPESNELHFFYDAQSRPAMVNFNGTLYTYVHNLQGDIVAIVDSAGTKVVEYKYDAWGKPLTGFPTGTLKDTLGKVNPFLYRGYMYDEETSLYYLRSRYYNPELGRFVNEDSLIGKVGALGQNMFAYCSGNPIMNYDPTGRGFWPFDKISEWFHGKIDEELNKHKNVNSTERAYAHSHPLEAYQGYSCSELASSLTGAIFGPGWDVDDTKANAVKHCLWNIIMTYDYGEEFSKTIADNHEAVYDGKHTEMDLHNNKVGRSLGKDKNIFDVSRFYDTEYQGFLATYPNLRQFNAVDNYRAYLAMQALASRELQVNKP